MKNLIFVCLAVLAAIATVNADLFRCDESSLLTTEDAVMEADLFYDSSYEAESIKVNLRMADLSYADLSYADLGEIDLLIADLYHFDLGKTDLFRNDLSYVALDETDLLWIDTSDTSLYHANLIVAIHNVETLSR
jgi:uncharacterized protein YjbI with pentapeptide repeats